MNEPRESRKCMSIFDLRSIIHRPISIESQWVSKNKIRYGFIFEKNIFQQNGDLSSCHKLMVLSKCSNALEKMLRRLSSLESMVYLPLSM
jgi:hypothetical protein